MSGWVKIHRKIMDSPIWACEPFSRSQAWIDLIMLANHKDGYIVVAGEKLPIKRGQCGWSQLKLSSRWKWSRGKTKRFVNQLELEGKIVQQTNTRNTIITICNYSLYQGDSTTDEQEVEQQTVQQTDIRRDTNKNVKKDKNDKEDKNTGVLVLLPDWLPLTEWESYCQHRGKKFTDNAKQIAIRKLSDWKDAGHSPVDILNNSIMNGWQGLFEPKEGKKNGTQKSKLGNEAFALLERIRATGDSENANDHN